CQRGRDDERHRQCDADARRGKLRIVDGGRAPRGRRGDRDTGDDPQAVSRDHAHVGHAGCALAGRQLAFVRKWARRFLAQHAGVFSVHIGRSLPYDTMLMRRASIPCATRYVMAALALRSPSARLYSLVPRSSQWPSISRSWVGLAFRWLAWGSSVLAPSRRTMALSKSKKMSFTAGFAT